MSQARRKRRAERQARESARGSATEPTLFSREIVWIAAGLLVLIGVAYAPAWQLGFVRFDDPQYVTENSHVASGLTLQGIGWALTTSAVANWHPLTWMSHMLDVQLFGMNPAGHHATNVVLHAANTLLLFAVLTRMTRQVWPSAIVAGFFGLHPIHVESVAWVAERKDVLSAFFWMLTLWAYVGFVKHRGRGRYLVMLLLFALALMAKPMVVTLPFALLLLDFWPLNRVSRETWRSDVRGLVVEKLPLFALSAASSIITFLVQRQGGTVAASVRLSFLTRAENAVVSYVTYLGKMLWPAHLAAYYPYATTISMPAFVGSLLLLATVSIGAVMLARRYPYVLVGWLWYLGTLVPAIGLVQVGTQAMADRYSYIPAIGAFIIVAWGARDLLMRWPQSRQIVAIGTAVALVASTAVARAQVRYWQSSTSLWKHALDVTTDNYAAHTYMGNALATQGDLPGAIAQYTEALRIRPDFPEAHNNLGPALARSGRLDEAIAHFTEAIRIRPTFVDAHSNLGVALATRGRWNEAVAHYEEAIRLDPEHASAHGNLGLALRALGRNSDAVRELEIATRLNPSNTEVRDALAALRAGAKP